MSQETINKSLQKTLLSPLTHDSLWSQFLESMSYELHNMQNEYALIKNNWNINENDKDGLIRISESFGYSPNLIINNTVDMAKLEIESIPFKIRKKTTYNGYSLIFQQNNSKGDTFNYYWNGTKLIKIVDYDGTSNNLIESNHYSPFYGILPIKNYSVNINSNNIILDNEQYDDTTGEYIYSLDQKIGSSIWKLDESYLKIPTKHLGIEYFPNNFYCTYQTTLGISSQDELVYETQIQSVENYINESMKILINGTVLNTTIETDEGKEFFTDDYGILNSNSYFDIENNIVHLEFNFIPSKYEISIKYDINLLMTSDYFYYLEHGMEYNRRCPIIPHCGIFLSADIAESRGSDFYYPNEKGYTVPDLKLKAITASAYNRYITLSETMILDNATDSEGHPSGKENYKFDSSMKWHLDSATSQTQSLVNNFKYIACGNHALNVIDEEHNQIFNQNYILFYYNLNSDDDSSMIYDISSNALNCNVVGDRKKIKSIIDKSLNFNGETYANSDSNLDVSQNYDYSFGMWFKVNENGNENNLIKTLFDSFIQIQYTYETHQLMIDFDRIHCTTNEYHFLCILFNHSSDTISIYLDCELFIETSYHSIISSSKIYIGKSVTDNDYFYGEIDNVWLLSKLISLDEMSYIYNEKISVISHMGNRLSYYPLFEDEKYENENYTLVQSYVKSMDINNETLILNQDDSDYITFQTKFYPILSSYFNMTYKNSFGRSILIQSNEKGEFYDKETGEIITGSINFKDGICKLAKNTIKSVSLESLASQEQTTYASSYNIINTEQHTSKWYNSNNVEINADKFDISRATLDSSLFTYRYGSDPTSLYTENNESFYILHNNNKEYVSLYIANSDDDETSLFSKDGGQTLYSSLSNLNSDTNQVRAFYDLGEPSSTLIYTMNENDKKNAYLNISSAISTTSSVSTTRLIRKWTLTINGSEIIGYTLGSDTTTYYSNLLFNSIIEGTPDDTEPINFNPLYVSIKCTNVGFTPSVLNLRESKLTYSNMIAMNFIDNLVDKSVIPNDIQNNIEILKDSVTFDYWIEINETLQKQTVKVSENGVIADDYSYGRFDFTNNTVTIDFIYKPRNQVVVSYEYYHSLDLDYNQPLSVNYKTENSIQVNEIGLENENHELMAYMTFPNVEFNTIYDNLSAMFAIAKTKSS